MMIKRPGSAADDASGIALQRSLDDEPVVINHEDQTVISDVPELQDFNASQQSSMGVMASESELREILGGAQPLRGSLPSRAPAIVAPFQQVRAEVAINRMQAEASPGTASTTARKGNRAEKAFAASQRTPTATADKPRPHASAAKPVVRHPVMTERVVTAAKPKQVAHSPEGPGVPSMATSAMPLTRGGESSVEPMASMKPALARDLPVGIVLVGAAGLVCLVAGIIGQLTQLTVLGAVAGLCSFLAAGLTTRDLNRSGSINLMKVFMVPAFVGAALLAVLLKA